ncbi:CNVH-domain-containing protein [Daldinia caldariorum]|uniref:CNVH-domain-containing protein n=1 Tax=Daldinia caldariorum TaxID=326644 RepID=UPI00200779E5|nr:CNVH-domain-containing protein [Daldinia caldariorum]KAI1467819.1 CNVH-domain-containing protein [Daldinia caldariorum]
MAFSQSSRDLRLDKPDCTLHATCRTPAKTEQKSRLDLDTILGNSNGRFEVGSSNFSKSATEIRLEGTILSARLRDKDGVEREDTINLDAVLENVNGKLTFLEPKKRIERNLLIPLRPRQQQQRRRRPNLEPPSCNICQDWPDPQQQDVFLLPGRLLKGKPGCMSCDLLAQVFKHCKPDRGKVQRASCAAEKPTSDRDLHRVHLEYQVEGGGETIKKTCILHRPPNASDLSGVFAELRKKYLPGKFASPGSVKQARAWLEACVEKHEKCESFRRSPLPARVLDVGSNDSDPVRLLCVTDNREDTYACLSHCWGKPKEGENPLTLTVKKEEDLKQRIPLDDLPKNYQDAIRFCRLLDIRYLWIDALCIIQDSAEDWTGESLKMASYYGNCTTRMEYQLPGTTGPAGCILATEKPLEVPHFWLAKKFPFGEYYPLLTRAWVYQERRLSPRILHFCGNELVFECKHHTACECEDISADSTRDYDSWTKAHEAYLATHRDATKVDIRTRAEHECHTLIRAYSQLNLTFVGDRLPAMSGLAQHARRMRETYGIPTGKYLAGLWEETLLNDMSWCVGRSRARIVRGEDGGRNWVHWANSKERKTGAIGTKPDDYVAPSWSWASVLSPVEFAPFAYKKFLCQLHSVKTETTGPNEYGRVASGHAILQGRLLETAWDETEGKMRLKDALGTRLPGPEVLWTKVFNLVKDHGMIWFPDYDLFPLASRPIMGRDEDSDIRIRLYPGKTKVETVYLVLRRTQSSAPLPVFERVGWAEYTGVDGDKVPDMTMARDTKFKLI